jgi:hypothetical protein
MLGFSATCSGDKPRVRRCGVESGGHCIRQ